MLISSFRIHSTLLAGISAPSTYIKGFKVITHGKKITFNSAYRWMVIFNGHAVPGWTYPSRTNVLWREPDHRRASRKLSYQCQTSCWRKLSYKKYLKISVLLLCITYVCILRCSKASELVVLQHQKEQNVRTIHNKLARAAQRTPQNYYFWEVVAV